MASINPLTTGAGNALDGKQTIIAISKGDVRIQTNQSVVIDTGSARQGSAKRADSQSNATTIATNGGQGTLGDPKTAATDGTDSAGASREEAAADDAAQAVISIMTPSGQTQGQTNTKGFDAQPEWLQNLLRPGGTDMLFGSQPNKTSANSSSNDGKAQPSTGDQVMNQVTVRINQNATAKTESQGQKSQSLDLDPFQAGAYCVAAETKQPGTDTEKTTATKEPSLGDRVLKAIVDTLVAAFSPSAKADTKAPVTPAPIPAPATTPVTSSAPAPAPATAAAPAPTPPVTSAKKLPSSTTNPESTTTTTTTKSGAGGTTTTTTTTTTTSDGAAVQAPSTPTTTPIQATAANSGNTKGADDKAPSLGDQLLSLIVLAIAKALLPAATEAQKRPNITLDVDGGKTKTQSASTTASAAAPSLGDQVLAMIGRELNKQLAANSAPTKGTVVPTTGSKRGAEVGNTSGQKAIQNNPVNTNPAISNPAISNPAVSNPAIANPKGTVQRTQTQSNDSNGGNTKIINNDNVKVTGSFQKVA
jgi:hypothetical protein